MTRPVTIPLAPWDATHSTDPARVLEPAPAHMKRMIRNTFAGDVQPSDLAYMAKALLQMADEVCELRKRVADLEAGR